MINIMAITHVELVLKEQPYTERLSTEGPHQLLGRLRFRLGRLLPREAGAA